MPGGKVDRETSGKAILCIYDIFVCVCVCVRLARLQKL